MGQRAWIYTRISRSRDGDDLGVRRQETACRKRVADDGAEVFRVVEDNDVSATRRKARPGFEALLRGVQLGDLDVIYAMRSDRLLRKPGDLERLFEACEEATVSVVYVDGQGFDPVTGDGMLEARFRALFDAEEVSKLKKRVNHKVEELAMAGKVSGGGTRAFGFEADRVTINEAEAVIIRDAAKRLLAGETTRGVALDLNRRGITTTAGKPWGPQPVRRMITSWRLCGVRELHGEPVADAVWQPILKRSQTESLRALLLDPARRTNHGGNARKYLLAGFAYCGLCGAKLVARPRGDKRRCMVCASDQYNGCGKIRTLAEPMEDLIRDAVFTALNPALIAKAVKVAKTDDSHDAKLVAQLRADEARLEELRNELGGEDGLDVADFRVAKKRITERMDATRKRLGESSGAGFLASLPTDHDALRAEWEINDLSWRRAIVSAVIESVTVGAAVRGRNRFDPDRFSITWRQ